MIAEGKTGPIVASDQTINTARLSKDCSVVSQDSHARYQEAVYRGGVYSACSQAGQALTALGTAMTGFILYNPIASGKNLVVASTDFVVSAAPAAAVFETICLAAAVGPNVAAPTTTTKLTIVNNLLNGAAASVALALSTGTFAGVTPTLLKPLKSVQLGTAAADLYDVVAAVELAGQVVVPPGAYVAFAQSPSATLLTAVMGMTWEEINV